VELVADLVGLGDAVEGADLVVTGEGLLDVESFDGKVVGGVAELALDLGVPVVAVVGAVDPDGVAGVVPEGVSVVSLTERFGSERSLNDVEGCLREVAATLV
jgi:glycerate kinase